MGKNKKAKKSQPPNLKKKIAREQENIPEQNLPESVNQHGDGNHNFTNNGNDSIPLSSYNMGSRVAKKSTTSTPASLPPPPPSTIAAAKKRQYHTDLNVKDRSKFLENFNPNNSARERRKIEKKIQNRRLTGCINDQDGVHIATGKDMCDCLDLACPGCFFPCRKCGSCKCGVECRAYRKHKYESVEYHGYSFTKINPLEK